MLGKYTSEDNWLVQLLMGATLGAVAFFLLTPGPVAENLGLVPEVQTAAVAKHVPVKNKAAEKAPEHARVHALPMFTDETTPVIDGDGVFEGELVIGVGENFIEDEGLVSADHFYYLYDKVTDTVLELRPKDTLSPGLGAGAMIRAKGVVKNGMLEVGGAVESPSSEQVGSLELVEAADTQEAGATENLRVAVIGGHFNDKNLSCSAATMNSAVFGETYGQDGGSVQEGYSSASNGSIATEGNVFGPYAIDHSSTNVNLSGWASALKSAAAADGFSISDYDTVVYVLPKNAHSYGGYGYYGGDAYIYYCDRPFIYQHELGHTMYLGHASAGSDEYGDNSSFMGGHYGIKHANAPHTIHKNWIASDSIINNPSSGTYVIDSLDDDPATVNDPQVIKLPKSDTSEDYFVSLRTADRVAVNMPSQYHNTVQIHHWTGGTASTKLIQSLTAGQTWTDSVNGLSVTVDSIQAGTSATLNVTYSSPTCDSKAPTVTISPNEVGSNPGATAEYNVQIRNNDSSICSTASIALSSTDDSASLSTSLSSSQISLAPGASGNVTLRATSNETISGDSHMVRVTASNDGKSGSDTALYTLDGTAPTAPRNLSANKKRKSVNLSWNSAADNVGVAGYEVIRNGEVIDVTQSTSYADRAYISGVNSYTVRAYDAAGNSSPLSNTVTVDTGGGGDTGDGDKSKCSPWPSCRNN